MIMTIYAIAKNEENFAERFAKSCKDADHIIVCDTGSTDNTIDILEKNNVKVFPIQVNPWRFDLARNLSLLHVPEDTDVAIAMDLDDVLVDNWREIVENEWEEGLTNLRYLYPYGWQDVEQTIPNLIVWGFKVHCPKSYVWADPIHEWLSPKDGVTEKIKTIEKELLIHRPEDKEERNNRLHLFELGVQESPNSERLSYLYGRELFFFKEYEKAISELKRCLKISESYAEYRDVSLAMTRAKCCKLIARSMMEIKKDPGEIITWLLRYVSESPAEREPWIYLAKGWKAVKDYVAAYACINRALTITDKTMSAEFENWCWDESINEFAEELRLLALGQLNSNNLK